jgi:hypothetical protein
MVINEKQWLIGVDNIILNKKRRYDKVLYNMRILIQNT